MWPFDIELMLPLLMWPLEPIAPVEVDCAKAVPASNVVARPAMVSNREIFVMDVSKLGWVEKPVEC
jgi:hypothetical protein